MIELYHFRKDTPSPENFYFTSGDIPITYLTNVYQPIPIGRSTAESKAELSKSSIEITFSDTVSFANSLLQYEVEFPIRVFIYSVASLAYPNNVPEAVTIVWMGRVTSIKPADSQIKLMFESIFTSMRRPGLRRRFQLTCPHQLYSASGCKVNPFNFDVPGSAYLVNGSSVYVDAAAFYNDGYFKGGMLTHDLINYRLIRLHVYDSLILSRPIKSMQEAFALNGSVPLFLFPGCDRTMSTCNTRFNNLPNNGSFPFIPIRNPYNGKSIV